MNIKIARRNPAANTFDACESSFFLLRTLGRFLISYKFFQFPILFALQYKFRPCYPSRFIIFSEFTVDSYSCRSFIDVVLAS